MADAEKFGLPEKSPSALRTIGEVAEELGLPQHVLRFWESKFSQISPLKRRGGRRFYRPEDVEIIGRIRDLLHDKGYTIKGAQQALSDGGGVLEADQRDATPSAAVQQPSGGAGSSAHRKELEKLLSELKALKELLAPAA